MPPPPKNPPPTPVFSAHIPPLACGHRLLFLALLTAGPLPKALFVILFFGKGGATWDSLVLSRADPQLQPPPRCDGSFFFFFSAHVGFLSTSPCSYLVPSNLGPWASTTFFFRPRSGRCVNLYTGADAPLRAFVPAQCELKFLFIVVCYPGHLVPGLCHTR